MVLKNCSQMGWWWCWKTTVGPVGGGVEKLRPGGSVMVLKNHSRASGRWCWKTVARQVSDGVGKPQWGKWTMVLRNCGQGGQWWCWKTMIGRVNDGAEGPPQGRWVIVHTGGWWCWKTAARWVCDSVQKPPPGTCMITTVGWVHDGSGTLHRQVGEQAWKVLCQLDIGTSSEVFTLPHAFRVDSQGLQRDSTRTPGTFWDAWDTAKCTWSSGGVHMESW